MGDRVAVMKAGLLQQVGNPQFIYDNPDNLFVAGFIGSPPMNMALARIEREGDGLAVKLGSARLALAPAAVAGRAALKSYVDREVAVGIRSEDMEDARLVRDGRPDTRLRATVNLTEALGSADRRPLRDRRGAGRHRGHAPAREGLRQGRGGAPPHIGHPLRRVASRRARRFARATRSRSSSTPSACTSSIRSPAWRSGARRRARPGSRAGTRPPRRRGAPGTRRGRSRADPRPGGKLRTGERRRRRRHEREVARAGDDLEVHARAGGESGQHALDERDRNVLVALPGAHHQRRAHLGQRARPHQPRERGRQQHQRADARIRFDRDRMCHAVRRLIGQRHRTAPGRGQRRVAAGRVPDHGGAAGQEVRAEVGVGERGVEREPHVPRPVGQVRRRPVERVVGPRVAGMLDEHDRESTARQMRRQPAMTPRRPALAVRDRDHRQARADHRPVDRDVDRVRPEALGPRRRAGRVQHSHRHRRALCPIVDLEHAAAGVHGIVHAPLIARIGRRGAGRPWGSLRRGDGPAAGRRPAWRVPPCGP